MYVRFAFLPAMSLLATLCSGLSLENTISDTSSKPCIPSSADDQKCPQSFLYKQELDPLLGGSTSMNYILTKNSNIEKATVVANYSRNGLTGKVIGTYKNNLADPLIGSSSDARFNLAYKTKFFDSLSVIGSETVYLPEQDTIPISYTSALEAKYPLHDNYSLYTQGTYSYLKERSEVLSPLENPYSTSIGIDHTNASQSFIRALYTQTKEEDPSLKPNKAIKLIAKRKIGKKVHTTLSVKKNIEPSLQEDKGLVSLQYTF